MAANIDLSNRPAFSPITQEMIEKAVSRQDPVDKIYTFAQKADAFTKLQAAKVKFESPEYRAEVKKEKILAALIILLHIGLILGAVFGARALHFSGYTNGAIGWGCGVGAGYLALTVYTFIKYLPDYHPNKEMIFCPVVSPFVPIKAFCVNPASETTANQKALDETLATVKQEGQAIDAFLREKVEAIKGKQAEALAVATRNLQGYQALPNRESPDIKPLIEKENHRKAELEKVPGELAAAQQFFQQFCAN